MIGGWKNGPKRKGATVNELQKLKQYVKDKNVTVIQLEKGHVQIKGKLLVNYYPLSKNRTAYIAGTRRGFKNIGHKQAVTMALVVPQINKHHKKRKMVARKKAQSSDSPGLVYFTAIV